jgi:NADH-quinone oxidoreductase subunit E
MRIERIDHCKRNITSDTNIDLTLLNDLIEKYQNKRGAAISLLQGTQKIYGYIPTEAFEYISEKSNIEESILYGVATFYTQFRLNPVGKNIVKICHGTACHVQNATDITDALKDELSVNDGETTHDGVFTLESVACLGCCSLAPVMMIGEETYGNLTTDQARKIIKQIRKNEQQ